MSLHHESEDRDGVIELVLHCQNAGTIGLMNKGQDLGILKKFFVYEPYRGKPHNLGQSLYRTLLNYAHKHNFKKIILDTPKNTERAHRFYEKAGFTKIEKQHIPFKYDYPYTDSDFFIFELAEHPYAHAT